MMTCRAFLLATVSPSTTNNGVWNEQCCSHPLKITVYGMTSVAKSHQFPVYLGRKVSFGFRKIGTGGSADVTVYRKVSDDYKMASKQTMIIQSKAHYGYIVCLLSKPARLA